MTVKNAKNCLAIRQFDVDNVGVLLVLAPSLHACGAVGQALIIAEFGDFFGDWLFKERTHILLNLVLIKRNKKRV